MFDTGMQELIVIFIVTLIVFEPKRLLSLGELSAKVLQTPLDPCRMLKSRRRLEWNPFKNRLRTISLALHGTRRR